MSHVHRLCRARLFTLRSLHVGLLRAGYPRQREYPYPPPPRTNKTRRMITRVLVSIVHLTRKRVKTRATCRGVSSHSQTRRHRAARLSDLRPIERGDDVGSGGKGTPAERMAVYPARSVDKIKPILSYDPPPTTSPHRPRHGSHRTGALRRMACRGTRRLRSFRRARALRHRHGR